MVQEPGSGPKEGEGEIQGLKRISHCLEKSRDLQARERPEGGTQQIKYSDLRFPSSLLPGLPLSEPKQESKDPGPLDVMHICPPPKAETRAEGRGKVGGRMENWRQAHDFHYQALSLLTSSWGWAPSLCISVPGSNGNFSASSGSVNLCE